MRKLNNEEVKMISDRNIKFLIFDSKQHKQKENRSVILMKVNRKFRVSLMILGFILLLLLLLLSLLLLLLLLCCCYFPVSVLSCLN